MTSTSFDGATFSESRDGSRLASQLADVRTCLRDGCWWGLDDIQSRTGHPQASISARIRDLRKTRNGAHTIERRYLHNGLWQYRLKLPLGQLSLGLM